MGGQPVLGLFSGTGSAADGSDREWPLVTVVILACNRREPLQVTLRELRDSLAYPEDRLEIILVDNASDDGTPAMVADEFPRVSVIRNDANVGIAGWNQGFERGHGQYFLVLDDDCYMTGDSLRRAVTMAGACRADLVSFVALSTCEPGYVFNDDYDPGLLAFWGCAALLSRRAVTTLGGFDPSIFIWAHEVEFTMRLLDRGLCHLFVPDIVVHHMSEPAPRLTPLFHRTNMRNLSYIVAKLLRPRDAVMALANLLTTALMRAAADPRMVLCLPAIVEGARSGIRRRSPVGRRVSALYRSNFADFVSPFRFVRGRDSSEVTVRRRRFWRARPQLYPGRAAWLQVGRAGSRP